MAKERRGYWDIEALVPIPDWHPNGLQETRLGIVASSLDEAIAEFRKRHPDARIWATRRKGDVDIIAAKAGGNDE